MKSQPVRTLAAVAVGALFAGAALAQTYGTTPPPAVTGKAPAAGQSALAKPSSAMAAQGKALSARDRKFVTTANEAGAAEIEMARIAMERASASEVKDFASRMVSDHQKADQDLDRIAASKGLSEGDKLSAKDQAELDKLRKLQGAGFDREYVKSQLAAHKAAVALFEKQSKSGNDSDLKQFAASTLPTLQDHLQLVEQLSKSPPRATTAPDKMARSSTKPS
ncbi:MAG: DUF4142 domain-containing protein [Casimicrobiaceae bacterium]